MFPSLQIKPVMGENQLKAGKLPTVSAFATDQYLYFDSMTQACGDLEVLGLRNCTRAFVAISLPWRCLFPTLTDSRAISSSARGEFYLSTDVPDEKISVCALRGPVICIVNAT